MRLGTYPDKVRLVPDEPSYPRKSNPWKGLTFFLGFLLLLIVSAQLVFVYNGYRFSSEHSTEKHHHSKHANHTEGISARLNSLLNKMMGDQCTIDHNKRFDCDPNPNTTKAQCESLGCCWSGPAFQSKPTGPLKNVPLGEPYCFFPTNYVGYSVSKENVQDYTYDLVLRRKTPTSFVDVPTVVVQVTENPNSIDFVTNSVQSKDLNLPKSTRKRVQVNKSGQTFAKNYYTKLENGVFSVFRSNNHRLIWSANLQTMIYAKGFRQLNTGVPVQGLYGLGERMDDYYKKDFNYVRYSFFNRDRIPWWKLNLYGTQPIYLMIEEDGQAHQLTNANEYPSEAILHPATAVVWRTLGGDFKIHIEVASNPLDAISQTSLSLGTSEMPPVWALGFQLCRYGYNSLNETRATYQRMRDAKIPYDVQWNDIDYMDGYNDFTFDPVAFAGLPEFIDELHQNNMHYVVMLDPGLDGTYINTNKYANYSVNTVIQNPNGTPLRGKVWNKNWTAWIDFTGAAGYNFWINQILAFHKQLDFDGIWIDMNDPSNEVYGSLDGCIDNELDRPQYLPGDDLDPIYKFTACMSAKHANGTHFDYHNSYNLFESAATNTALRKLNKRPFIISRSTFVGSGAFTGHWTGDVVSNFEYLKQSVVGMLDFNLFSIPMVGADICGFNGNTTVELCARWQQLGAFYPFSRNHNTNDGIPQDPPSLGEVVVTAARKALLLRYRLHNLLYTLFYEATVYGRPVIRSMATLAPQINFIRDVSTQFMWGDSLMVVPVLEEGATSALVAYTPGYWYDFETYYYLSQTIDSVTYTLLDAPIDTIRLAVRGGSILTLQHPEMTIPETRKNPLEIVVFYDHNLQANGTLFWDDGVSLDTIEKGEYKYFEMTANNTWFSFSSSSPYRLELPPVANVTFVGLPTWPVKVTVNDLTAPFRYDTKLIVPIPPPFQVISELKIAMFFSETNQK